MFNRFLGVSRAVGMGIAIIGLAGCANQPLTSQSSAPEADMTRDWGRPVSSQLADFLAQSPPGASTAVADSPWGKNVTLSVQRRYYAASGRECRKLTIEGGSDAPQKGIACDADQGWVYVRAVTHEGQSIGGSKE